MPELNTSAIFPNRDPCLLSANRNSTIFSLYTEARINTGYFTATDAAADHDHFTVTLSQWHPRRSVAYRYFTFSDDVLWR